MPTVIALDVGEKRIGVARATTEARIPEPLTTLANDDKFDAKLTKIIVDMDVQGIVVGLPRGLDGQDTAQTEYVRQFIADHPVITDPIFQDEAVTSLQAEEILRASGKPYQKDHIDAGAAAIILRDYLETHK